MILLRSQDCFTFSFTIYEQKQLSDPKNEVRPKWLFFKDTHREKKHLQIKFHR